MLWWRKIFNEEESNFSEKKESTAFYLCGGMKTFCLFVCCRRIPMGWRPDQLAGCIDTVEIWNGWWSGSYKHRHSRYTNKKKAIDKGNVWINAKWKDIALM